MPQMQNARPVAGNSGAGAKTAGEDVPPSVPPAADIPPGYVRGCDGKVYPYRPLPQVTRAQIVGRVHYLSHELHLSVRQIVARLAEGGFRASVGTVHGWLRSWNCDHCSGVPISPPEHRPGAAA